MEECPRPPFLAVDAPSADWVRGLAGSPGRGEPLTFRTVPHPVGAGEPSAGQPGPGGGGREAGRGGLRLAAPRAPPAISEPVPREGGRRRGAGGTWPGSLGARGAGPLGPARPRLSASGSSGSCNRPQADRRAQTRRYLSPAVPGHRGEKGAVSAAATTLGSHLLGNSGRAESGDASGPSSPPACGVSVSRAVAGGRSRAAVYGHILVFWRLLAAAG